MVRLAPALLMAVAWFLVPTRAALADPLPADGEHVFATVCQACHQAGGIGVPGLAPALAGTLGRELASEEGRQYVALVLLNGLSGPIRSQGQLYAGAMPAQAKLSDGDLAAAASYVAQTLNGAGNVTFAAEDFARLRVQPVAHKALRQMRERLAGP